MLPTENLRQPYLSESCPRNRPATAKHRAEGPSSSPVSQGVNPLTPCKKKGMRKKTELPAMKVMKLAALPQVNNRRRNNSRANMGCGARDSHQMKTPSISATAPNALMAIGDVQPTRWALVTTSSSTDSAAAESVAPSQSNPPLPSSFWPAGEPDFSTNNAIASDSKPKGTPRKKAARHPNTPTTAPHTIGPAIAPKPTVVIIIPMALPRSAAGKVVVTMAMPLAWIIAAPTPCNALNAMM